MADDIMEISSDHGLHGGDDIDFEFELTAPTGDDDAMLDAAYNPDLTFSPNRSPAAGNDDLMVDEEDNSTSIMYDAESAHGEGDHDLEAMSFTSIDASHIDGDKFPNTAEHLDVGNDLEDTNDSIQQQDFIEHSNPGGTETEFISEAHDFQEAEIGYEDDNVDTRDFASQAQFDQATQQHSSPPRSLSGQVLGSAIPQQLTSEHSTPKSRHEDVFEADSLNQDHAPMIPAAEDEPQVTKADPQNEVEGSPAVEVIVLYNSNDYALFSSSELDDPDSFFVSDRSISDKPLHVLFAAIRSIINEEIGNEDELCLAIKALELEVEEMSASLQDITFTQILALYEKLLSNEGIESQPLYIELSTRRAFSTRFANLSAAAAEGRGLSEFTTWNENADSLGDSGEPEPGEDHVDTAQEEEPLDDGIDGESSENHEGKDGAHATGNHVKESERSESQDKALQEQSSTKLSSATGNPVSRGSTNTYTAAAVARATEASNELDGEDLIDYSDEEVDHDPKESNPVRSDTDKAGNDDNSETFEENDQVDEPLLGDDGEDGLGELKYDGAVENDEVTDENYPGDNTDHHPQHDTVHEDAGLSTLDGVASEYDEQDPSIDPHDHEALQFSHENYDGHDHGDEEQHEEIREIVEESTNYIEANIEPIEDGNDVGGDQGVDNFDLGTEDWADPSFAFAQDQPTVQFDSAETAASSETVSPDENVHKAAQEEVIDLPGELGDYHSRPFVGTAIIDPNDEIDYEDDEEEVPTESQAEPNAVVSANDEISVNGKRPRAESADEEALSNKDAKRPRSRS